MRYIPSGAVGGPIDGTINLTGVTVASGTYGTSPGFAVLGGKPIVVNGTLTDDLITGTLANEAFIGLTGDDTINAGGGNDVVVYNVGDGQDTVDGQGGTDTLGLINFNGTVPSATPATFAISQSGGHLIVQTDGTGAAEVDAAGMESVQVTLGNGGDTVTLTGNIAGAGIAAGPGGIIVTGGTSGDTLDASGLGSASAITFSNLGGGNDTFKAANVVANDVVDAAGGTGDLLDYSAATAARHDRPAGEYRERHVGRYRHRQQFRERHRRRRRRQHQRHGGREHPVGRRRRRHAHRPRRQRYPDRRRDRRDARRHGGLHRDDHRRHDRRPTARAAGPSRAASAKAPTRCRRSRSVQGANPLGLRTGKFLLVGNGGYATIAAAYAEAVDGDTIVLAAGTYTGDFTIAKAISVVGANYNVTGAGSRGAESVLTGHWTVNAASRPGHHRRRRVPQQHGVDQRHQRHAPDHRDRCDRRAFAVLQHAARRQ